MFYRRTFRYITEAMAYWDGQELPAVPEKNDLAGDNNEQ